MAARKRNYKKEYQDYHSKPEQIKRRSERNQARRIMEQSGQARKGDGKDVHHKDGNTANRSRSNLSVVSVRYNRGTRNRKRR
jgi:hypothetical protein